MCGDDQQQAVQFGYVSPTGFLRTIRELLDPPLTERSPCFDSPYLRGGAPFNPHGTIAAGVAAPTVVHGAQPGAPLEQLQAGPGSSESHS
jgi:hypothetical protein